MNELEKIIGIALDQKEAKKTGQTSLFGVAKKDDGKKQQKVVKSVRPKKKDEEQKAPVQPTVEASEKAPAKKGKLSVTDVAYRSLAGPHVTEKATVLAEANKYVFRILPRATKKDVKQAVQEVYGVDVTDVKIIKVPGKRVRVGRRREGMKKGYKKAIVHVKEGQSIEIMPK